MSFFKNNMKSSRLNQMIKHVKIILVNELSHVIMICTEENFQAKFVRTLLSSSTFPVVV